MPQWAMAGAAVLGAFTSKKSADKAADAQKSGQTSAEQRIDAATQQARDDVNKLFPQAQQTAQQGFQQAADVFGSTIPQQAGQFQSGNMAAQQALLAGLPQQHNAILGNPIDYSQFQPYQAAPIDFGFANQQIGGGFGDFNGGIATSRPISPLTGRPIPTQAEHWEPRPNDPTGQGPMSDVFNPFGGITSNNQSHPIFGGGGKRW